MLDLEFIRNHRDTVLTGLKKKHASIGSAEVDKIIDLDSQRRQLINQLDDIRAAKNSASKEIAQLEGAEKQAAIQAMQSKSDEEKAFKEELQKIETDLYDLQVQIPNLPDADVPAGTEEDNKPFKTVGEPTKFDFEPKDHVELGEALDLIDLESAQLGSGARFYYLKNEAVLMQFALVQFAMQKLMEHNFTPVIPPVLVREEAMFATGFFPADRNEIYHVNPEDDNLFLVGTSEVPLTMLHAKDIIPSEKLPLRYFGYSNCFRREAGSYGKDTRGILRVHQFDKLEMFSFCHPDKSEAEHELIREIEEEIFTELGIPYQVINICAGDLGMPATKKYDIEAWIPTQDKYREVTSCSNYRDYTARRAQIRHKDSEGNITLLHTLNGTAVAMARTLIAIMENYQQKDGSIVIPEVLRPYMGGREVIKR